VERHHVRAVLAHLSSPVRQKAGKHPAPPFPPCRRSDRGPRGVPRGRLPSKGGSILPRMKLPRRALVGPWIHAPTVQAEEGKSIAGFGQLLRQRCHWTSLGLLRLGPLPGGCQIASETLATSLARSLPKPASLSQTGAPIGHCPDTRSRFSIGHCSTRHLRERGMAGICFSVRSLSGARGSVASHVVRPPGKEVLAALPCRAKTVMRDRVLPTPRPLHRLRAS
jgi:hypothetical protein